MDEVDLRPAFVVRHPGASVAPDLEMNEAGAALLQLFAGGWGLAAVLGAYAEATGKPPDEAAPDVIAFARDPSDGLLVPTNL